MREWKNYAAPKFFSDTYVMDSKPLRTKLTLNVNRPMKWPTSVVLADLVTELDGSRSLDLSIEGFATYYALSSRKKSVFCEKNIIIGNYTNRRSNYRPIIQKGR